MDGDITVASRTPLAFATHSIGVGSTTLDVQAFQELYERMMLYLCLFLAPRPRPPRLYIQPQRRPIERKVDNHSSTTVCSENSSKHSVKMHD